MREKLKKYLKVLRIELEDLGEDLQVMADIYNQREKRDEITGYVFLENMSLLKSEIYGIERIIESLDGIVVDRYKSLEDMIEHVDQEFRKETEDSGFPEACYALVKRKLLKVTKYMESNE